MAHSKEDIMSLHNVPITNFLSSQRSCHFTKSTLSATVKCWQKAWRRRKLNSSDFQTSYRTSTQTSIPESQTWSMTCSTLLWLSSKCATAVAVNLPSYLLLIAVWDVYGLHSEPVLYVTVLQWRLHHKTWKRKEFHSLSLMKLKSGLRHGNSHLLSKCWQSLSRKDVSSV